MRPSPSLASASRPPSHAAAGAASRPPHALPDGRGWALFVDLDGTLCPFVDDPATVELTAEQQETLMVLAARLDGALCVLSGRRSDDLDRILEGLDLVRIGDHGRARDERPSPALLTQLQEVEQSMQRLADAHAGTWVERKDTSCALHYRRAPRLAESLTGSLRATVAGLRHLRLLEGNCVLEATSARSNKGHALRRVMLRAPFAGRVPIALGDDVTDEDAFLAAQSLGGFGIAVGPRPSAAARHHLADTHAVNAWLNALAWNPGRSDDDP